MSGSWKMITITESMDMAPSAMLPLVSLGVCPLALGCLDLLGIPEQLWNPTCTVADDSRIDQSVPESLNNDIDTASSSRDHNQVIPRELTVSISKPNHVVPTFLQPDYAQCPPFEQGPSGEEESQTYQIDPPPEIPSSVAPKRLWRPTQFPKRTLRPSSTRSLPSPRFLRSLHALS
ncbi:uncharacterized protein K489DRAFT_236881 [Dissoconium aciculare CBS 342.82]|uniref:Uncharacterized protein n=1 Tax=Dissoconium aciculare CBS 342.82 TaxID=1314786 RepID=A0A6J3M2J6_9PEZI|nr:uncharacterized protein K489DRAFT_236881 [Dissoconium aciculare CBS 342.82]KAF1822246.1 hypothetical protein K489DRAFT_236881 [Dissoconium aciculare CBS 342.82]